MIRKTKHCPVCQANYARGDLRFCSQDGAELVDYSPTESDADTLRIGKGYDTNPLVVEQGTRIDLDVRVQPIAGDLAIHHSNEWAGTKGSSRALEGFSIRLIPTFEDLSLRYGGHFQGVGDVAFVDEGTLLRGHTLEPKRLEGFRIELTGPTAPDYDVFYSAHMAGWGDSRIFKNGEFCGTEGNSRGIEAIKVWLEPAGERTKR